MRRVSLATQNVPNDPFEAAPAPIAIHYDRAARELHLTYPDGETHKFPAEFLRIESPSAEVQGHGPDQRQTVPGKANVTITAIEPVGRYAVRLVFDDGHDTGLYSWRWFRDMIIERDDRWAAYLAALAEKGLSRHP